MIITKTMMNERSFTRDFFRNRNSTQKEYLYSLVLLALPQFIFFKYIWNPLSLTVSRLWYFRISFFFLIKEIRCFKKIMIERFHVLLKLPLQIFDVMKKAVWTWVESCNELIWSYNTANHFLCWLETDVFTSTNYS